MNVKELFLFVLILQTYEVSSIRTQMNICTGDGKVLPSGQVSGDDSCRRINATVMKIRLFKPKTPSNTEIFIAVKAFNSLAYFCLKGNNLHNRRSRPADKDIPTITA
jgi:hypothetical protein